MKIKITDFIKGLIHKPAAIRHKYPSPRIRNAYQAGAVDRLTASFNTISLSADAEIITSLKAIIIMFTDKNLK